MVQFHPGRRDGLPERVGDFIEAFPTFVSA
jgi:hypothetical protein